MPDNPDFEVIRRAWAATNEKDEATVRSCLDPEIVAIPLTVEGETYRGVEEVIGWWRENLANWESFTIVPEEFTRRGEDILVTGGWFVRGRESGVEMARPATWIVRVRSGRIVYWRTYTDTQEALAEKGPSSS